MSNEEKLDIADRIPGCLSQVDLEYDEREVLLDYMKTVYPRAYSDFIWSILGDKNFLLFYDVLEGVQMTIPSRKKMGSIISNVKIYMYLKSRDFSEDAYEKASVIFKKREAALRKICEIVDQAVTQGIVPEEEDEDGYINGNSNGEE